MCKKSKLPMNLSNYLALMSVLLSCLLSDASSRFRIFDGKISDINDKPHMVSLHHSSKYFCSGSLVNMNTVITAAHCVKHKRGEEKWVTVIAGAINMYAGGETRTAQRFIIPPTYNEKTFHMNIAAIKLRSPFIESNEIKPIELCDTDLSENTEIEVSGWGATRARFEPSAYLRTTVLKIVSSRDCGTKYLKVNREIPSSMICAGRQTYTCDGDGGAPGVVNKKMCTVASFGVGCGNCNYPGLYTSLNNARVLKFVQESMEA